MKPSDQETKLAYWLPKLEVYRTAMDATPEVAIAIPDSAEPDGEPVPAVPALSIYVEEELALVGHQCSTALRAVTQSEAWIDDSHGSESRATLETHGSESRATLAQVLHLPIDGILKKIKGLKPFVLGVGTVGPSETPWSRQVVRDTVKRCCDKTGREAILVSVRSSWAPLAIEAAASSQSFPEVRWSYFGDSKAETKAWHAQLADLPKWKKEFGLIVFDLGDVRLPTMPRIGRLCDGIVVQLLNAANSRDTIQALKALQKDRLTILGAWSVELNARSSAA